MKLFAAAALAVLCALPCEAQQASSSPHETTPPAWGTSQLSVLTIPVWTFENSAGPPLVADGYYRYRSVSGMGYAVAPFPPLPEGALIIGFQVDVCDTTPTGGLHALPNIVREGGTGLMSFGVGTGAAATPGCVTVSDSFFSPWRVRNATESYFLAITSDGTSATKVGDARIFFFRQISPAPSTATFGDVPVGHPFHRSVEALAASGIAGGCGNGNFCPDSAVSRGELAVLLVSALGLYFPN